MKYVLTALCAVGLAVFAIVAFRSCGAGHRNIDKRIKSFMACLPDTLRDEQRAEVKETLERFQRSVNAGLVAPKDRDDVISTLDRYIDEGKITKQELHVFLAKVGYYAIRETPDNQDIEGRMKPPDHPLLETPADSTGVPSFTP
jgi:CRISPR/Cas system-associated endoribonuclease Cas2